MVAEFARYARPRWHTPGRNLPRGAKIRRDKAASQQQQHQRADDSQWSTAKVLEALLSASVSLGKVVSSDEQWPSAAQDMCAPGVLEMLQQAVEQRRNDDGGIGGEIDEAVQTGLAVARAHRDCRRFVMQLTAALVTPYTDHPRETVTKWLELVCDYLALSADELLIMLLLLTRYVYLNKHYSILGVGGCYTETTPDVVIDDEEEGEEEDDGGGDHYNHGRCRHGTGRRNTAGNRNVDHDDDDDDDMTVPDSHHRGNRTRQSHHDARRRDGHLTQRPLFRPYNPKTGQLMRACEEPRAQRWERVLAVAAHTSVFLTEEFPRRSELELRDLLGSGWSMRNAQLDVYDALDWRLSVDLGEFARARDAVLRAMHAAGVADLDAVLAEIATAVRRARYARDYGEDVAAAWIDGDAEAAADGGGGGHGGDADHDPSTPMALASRKALWDYVSPATPEDAAAAAVTASAAAPRLAPRAMYYYHQPYTYTAQQQQQPMPMMTISGDADTAPYTCGSWATRTTSAAAAAANSTTWAEDAAAIRGGSMAGRGHAPSSASSSAASHRGGQRAASGTAWPRMPMYE